MTPLLPGWGWEYSKLRYALGLSRFQSFRAFACQYSCTQERHGLRCRDVSALWLSRLFQMNCLRGIHGIRPCTKYWMGATLLRYSPAAGRLLGGWVMLSGCPMIDCLRSFCLVKSKDKVCEGALGLVSMGCVIVSCTASQRCSG